MWPKRALHPAGQLVELVFTVEPVKLVQAIALRVLSDGGHAVVNAETGEVLRKTHPREIGDATDAVRWQEVDLPALVDRAFCYGRDGDQPAWVDEGRAAKVDQLAGTGRDCDVPVQFIGVQAAIFLGDDVHAVSAPRG
jgi:hypothetical protein